MSKLSTRLLVVAAAVALVVGGGYFAVQAFQRASRNEVVGYFQNTNQLFKGDDVLIQGVPVGKVEKIEPGPEKVKVTFWIDDKYKVPAEAKAVILSPQLVTGRAIQLIPPYRGGPTLSGGAVIPLDRTAVPVEWDQVRTQLQRVADLLKPDQPGGVSTLGGFINTAADNLRGQGASIRESVIRLSQAVSILGDHSNDLFSTFKNLSILVSALQDSTGLLERLNTNLAEVTGLLADDPGKVGQALHDMSAVADDVRSFVADNKEAVGTASDKLASVSTAIVGSLDDIKQVLHVAPTALADLNNIYEPAVGSLTGVLAVNNFANPVSFICGAIQAASRLGADQSSKLCAQYLAPIVKNRQYNFPPLGENLFVGTQARPNEVTYSEDWMRPDYVPPSRPAAPVAQQAAAAPAPAAPQTVATDANAGLAGMMSPPGGGS
ncbi:MCE family protein [Mycolicibacterium mucogenicum]|uniref:MCE family protein n=1 Tax=Mycolicibacterium mucogenicum DSM 44124 TaxID=1226753 RepID=A0A8H2JB77_MYCMU|nr:MCE family protein [Mycolicibacterium mucogenicum]KAB7759183.1 mammalian cell entry protein [Mycolicibacterium mucogenicum DSM 44124]QPG71113.1 MCE family protein [Mycolicibacterium mucogenicum DSM 44124]